MHTHVMLLHVVLCCFWSSGRQHPYHTAAANTQVAVCRIRNWRSDSLDGANAVTCNDAVSICGPDVSFACGNGVANVMSVVGARTGCQVQGILTATAGSSTASVALTLGTQSAAVGTISLPYAVLVETAPRPHAILAVHCSNQQQCDKLQRSACCHCSSASLANGDIYITL